MSAAASSSSSSSPPAIVAEQQTVELQQQKDAVALDAADGDPARTIKLISKGGASLGVPYRFALISTLVKTSLEQDPEATELAFPSLKDAVLPKIVEYMTHHQGVAAPIIAKPLRSRVMAEICADTWDADFIEEIAIDRTMLYDVILAANYMHITCLLHLGCAKVASLIKGEPLEKIKQILKPLEASGASSAFSAFSASSASASNAATNGGAGSATAADTSASASASAMTD